MRILVSGSSSGLGAYLKHFFRSESFNRNDVLRPVVNTLYYDMIIHCASSSGTSNDNTSSDKYIEDSLLITNYLLQLNCNYFVFISSVDIYPDKFNCRENNKIAYVDLKSMYSKSKFRSEEVIKNSNKKILILRPVAMLGEDIRQNSLTKMLNKQKNNISLSRDSIFNYVLHEDVGLFIQHCLIKKVQGVFNIASIGDITLGEIQEKFKLKDIIFGDYLYKTGDINIEKISSECNFFKKSSVQVIEYFINHLWRK